MSRVYKIIMGIILVISIFVFAETTTEVKQPQSKPQEISKDYGDIKLSTILEIDKDCSFKCSIESWPPVIGEAITVYIKGIKLKENEDIPKGKAAAFLQMKLRQGENMYLKNIQRANGSFALIARLEIDGNNIAEELIREGLAIKAEFGSLISPTKKKAILAPEPIIYVGSKNSTIFHCGDCSFAKKIKSVNLIKFGTKEQALKAGRKPCKACTP